MEYRLLGRSGLRVSELCLGSMTFGDEADEQTSHRLLDRFVEAGGNFVDTADVYEETLATLDDLVRAGKVRYLGVSNYAAWQLQRSVDVARHRGWEPFVALQPLYNLLDRDVELELVPAAV